MRSALLSLISIALVCGAASASEVDDSASPIVEQLLTRAAALELSAAQVQALQLIRDRRTQTLQVLRARLRATEAQVTAAATHDTVTLMQEIGRLQVLSGREALEQLTPAQRRRWVTLQARQTP
jgi:hypothetical protein